MSKFVYEPLVWRKSRYCETSACVEVALCEDGTALMRDGKNPGQVLVFDRHQWADFMTRVRSGELSF